MTRRPGKKLLSQPEPATSPAGAAAWTSALPATSAGPGIERVPATGDQPGELVDVGASSFTAAELAELKLPGLPAHRANISRLATKDRWPSIERQGRGGGRAFPITALPSQARAEIYHRRTLAQAAKLTGTESKPRAPRAALADFTDRQKERHAARTVVLETFDVLKGKRSARSFVEPFVAAYNAGELAIPAWVIGDVPTLSRRTVERWLAARSRGEDETIAGRWAGGRRSVFAQSEAASDFIIGAHATQPLLAAEDLRDLLETNFPQGVPDQNGILVELPSARAVARFLQSWKQNAANRAALVALTDPDRFKSHFRFAPGDAGAGIVRPNQLWQIDASPADVLCSDGRRAIYAVIDVATRRIMGLVTDTPKTTASLLLIARACQAWGMPETIGTDNGSDFVSRHFRITLRQLGVHHKIAPPYSPERKPFVERGIRSVQHKFMRLLPGFIGHNVTDRQQIRARRAFADRMGVSEAEQFDAVPLAGEELQERFAAWLANVYEQRRHAGLGGRTPHEVAVELLAEFPPRFADPGAVGMLLMPPASGGGVRVVSKKAIRVDNVDYWTDRLIPGQRLQVRLDPADMGRIYLYTDSDPVQFVGIGVNPDLAGLDRAELAARVRAEQSAQTREATKRLRKLIRSTDIHSVADRMIGRAPLPLPANTTATWSTPELEEAARAARHDGVAAIADLTDQRREQPEETMAERYARAKQLRSLVDEGREISAESRAWLEGYEGSHEWNGLRFLEDQAG